MKIPRIINYVYLGAFCLCMSWAEGNAQNRDFGGLNRYAKENRELSQPGKKEQRVIFMGNSITEGWRNTHPNFFKDNGYIGRGVSGQSSYQFLLRFREDVIKLSPMLVVINAGTNDIAENTSPYNEEYTFGNIISMAELAKANRIKVILTSTLPAASFGWNPSIKDGADKIVSLNNRSKDYAKKNKIPYVDYYQAMVTGNNRALNPAYTKDGVHPNSEGYTIMESLIKKAIDKAI